MPDETELITRQGIFPALWDQPELHQLVHFFDILKAFYKRSIWVHDTKNKRASLSIYLYRKLCFARHSSHPIREIWLPYET